MSILSEILGFDPQDALADAAGRMVQAAQVADAALALAAEAAGLPVSETGDELVTAAEAALAPYLVPPDEGLVTTAKSAVVESTGADTDIGTFGDQSVADDFITPTFSAEMAAIGDSLEGAGSLPSDQQVHVLVAGANDIIHFADDLSAALGSFLAQAEALRAAAEHQQLFGSFAETEVSVEESGAADCHFPPPVDVDVGVAIVGQADANYIFTGADFDRA